MSCYASAQFPAQLSHMAARSDVSLVHAAKFFWYFFFVFLNLLFFTSWGIIAVALTPNIQVSAVLSSGVYTFWLIFGGFIVPRPQIHGWWIWSVLLLLSVCFFILFLPLGSCSLCARPAITMPIHHLPFFCFLLLSCFRLFHFSLYCAVMVHFSAMLICLFL